MARATANAVDRSTGANDTILFIPRVARLLGRLVVDPRVPRRAKLKLAGAAAYLALPISIIGTDNHPLLGWLDDLVILLKVLRGLVDDAGEEVLRDNWSGPRAQLDRLVRALRKGDDALNSLVAKIKRALIGDFAPDTRTSMA